MKLNPVVEAYMKGASERRKRAESSVDKYEAESLRQALASQREAERQNRADERAKLSADRADERVKFSAQSASDRQEDAQQARADQSKADKSLEVRASRLKGFIKMRQDMNIGRSRETNAAQEAEDNDLPLDSIRDTGKGIVRTYKNPSTKETRNPFPQDPEEQEEEKGGFLSGLFKKKVR